MVRPEPIIKPTVADDALFKEEIRLYIKDKKSLESTTASLCSVVWGQCSKLIQNKLKASQKYTDLDNNNHVAALLIEIKLLSNKMEENMSTYDALHEAKLKFFRYQQAKDKTLADHMRNFKDLMNSIDYHGRDIFFNKEMVESEI